MALIHGAEAAVDTTVWMGRDAIVKARIPKPYRHPELDARLRAERTRDEANLLIQARRAGVPVPVVYDIDRTAATLTMEFVDAPALRDVLVDADDATAATLLQELGRHVGALHDAGLSHGDLTTSNVLVRGGLVLIDFGLGQFGEEPEPRGVDLHLVEEALEATDARAEALMEAFLEGYQPACRAQVLKRLEEIRLRGRYREAV